MRIAITGSSGLVGTSLVAELQRAGHTPVPLVRGEARPGAATWTPSTGAVDVAALGHVDAVVHLAGENVAAGRWTRARKRAIHESRGPATERLCRTLAALDPVPRVFVSASATGVYGDRGDEELDETSAPGTGFLADVARDWEAATAPLAAAGTRVVHLRLGVVLDRGGGALARMLLPFRLGLGGRLGSGRQWMSWIALPDAVRAFTFALADDTLRGPVLAVAPAPMTNREFTQALGRALHRPTVLTVPAFALRALFGEMADAMLLASQRAFPRRLQAAGFRFSLPNVDAALAAALAAR